MAKKLFVLLAVSTILMAPIIALSAPLNVGTAPAVTGNAISICFFANIIGKILDILWILFIAFAITMFIVAGFLFLKAHGEVADVATARKALLWGVVGVIVAVSAFMLPYFIRNTLVGGNNAANICAPANGPGGSVTNPAGRRGTPPDNGEGNDEEEEEDDPNGPNGPPGPNNPPAVPPGPNPPAVQCIPACNTEAGSVCINGQCTVQGF